MPFLAIEKGPDKGQSIHFEENCIIGRHPNSSLRLSDNAVSRNHFKIFKQESEYYIEDTESLNGTQVNSEFITKPTILKDGDRIGIGETIFLWEKIENKAQDPLISKELAGYLILERLGKGGMGIVYKAKQLSLQRDVALKILSPKASDDQAFIQRFIEEARACANLNHPNIIQVYDVGQAERYFYFSMEYAPCGSIQSMIAGGKSLHWEEALPLMLDTASGLEYAERKKIVHRDIKPDNLMLSEERRVKIVDLGLAKRIDQESQGQAKDGCVFGTPHFIAPEQAKGLSVDHRSDIYSFGASFYRILSGKPPFQGNNIRTILLKQLNEKQVSLKSFMPSIPEELSDMIDTMMQKNPDLRYASNSEIIERLQKLSKKSAIKTKKHSLEKSKVKINKAKSTLSMSRTSAMSRRDTGKKKQENSPSWPKCLRVLLPIVIINFFVFFFVSAQLSKCSPSRQEQSMKESMAKKEYHRLYALYENQGSLSEVIDGMQKIVRDYPNTEWGKKSKEFLWENKSKVSYEKAKEYQKSYPNEYNTILALYQKILQENPQISLTKTIQKEIEDIKAEKDLYEKELEKRLHQVLQKIDELEKDEKYSKAWDILESFQKECKDFPDISSKMRENRIQLEKNIKKFLEIAEKNFQENLKNKKFSEASLELEKLKENQKIWIIKEKLETLSKKIPKNIPKQEDLSKDFFDKKWKEFFSTYEWEKGTTYFQEQLKKKENASFSILLQDYADDMKEIHRLFKHIEKNLETTPLSIASHGWEELKNKIPALEIPKVDSIAISSMKTQSIQFNISSKEKTSLSHTVALSFLSQKWVYKYIIQQYAKAQTDLFLSVAIYCYYSQLYRYSKIWGEKSSEIDKGKERWAKLKQKIVEIEKTNPKESKEKED
ncbi:MAG: protein kinase [Candidatus Brocadiae bacterium]|nr:protein kinase [Candidatus Brocadiia bacterium]